MTERTPLAARAEGRWRAILPALGIATTFLTGKHGPCPMCSGKDRWRFCDRRGSGDWHCNQCGHGAGVELVKLFLKVEFKEAAERIEAVLGDTPRDEPRRGPDPEKQRRRMVKLWNSAKRIVASDTVGRYLAGRGLVLDFYPSCLRFAESAWFDVDEFYPAMLAQVVSAEGKAVQLHRTYLDGHGGKAQVEKPRRLMPMALSFGYAVRLAPAGRTLGVAEGIETAFAARQLFGHPVWALLNEGNLERFKPPAVVERLIIYGDNDANYVGQAAAFALAKRVGKAIATEVEIPPQAGDDWNDHLQRERKAAA